MVPGVWSAVAAVVVLLSLVLAGDGDGDIKSKYRHKETKNWRGCKNELSRGEKKHQAQRTVPYYTERHRARYLLPPTTARR